MAINFYKQGGSYYTTDGKKVLNLQELQKLASAGGKEISAPVINQNNQTAAPSGMVAIPGAQYNTREKQQAAFDNIQAIGNTLYGIPKQKTVTPVAIPHPSVIKDYTVTGRSEDGKTLLGIPKNETKQSETSVKEKPKDVNEKSDADIKKEEEERLEKENLQAAYDYIKSAGFDEATQEVLRQLAGQQYTSGNKVYNQSEIDRIISDSTLAAKQSLEPYYTTDSARSIEDLQNKISDIRKQADSYHAKEKLSYSQALKNTKESLMKSGRTFSSSSRDTIGNQSALGQRDIQNIEGALPEQRRLGVTEEVNSMQQNARDAGIKSERYLGSGQLSGVDFGTLSNPYATGRDYNPNSNTNLYTPAGGVTGDQILQRKKAELEAANARVKALYL